MRLRFALVFILPLFVSAQSDLVQAGGYVKYLFSSSELPTIGRVNDHLLHARLNSRWFFSEGLTAGVELRNRIFFGGSVEHDPNFLASVRSDLDIRRTDIVWWSAHSSAGYSELDRGWLDLSVGPFQCTVGRQRIAFGTALVWNPTDLFNPLSVLDFDYEERPGVDAVRLQYYSSEVSKVELAYKPGNAGGGSVIAAKILLNQWAYDLHILGGMRDNEPFGGFAWAGDIAGAGFRGEAIISRIGEDVRPIDPTLYGRWSFTLSLSLDYTFPNTLYLHSELLFNDRGVNRNAALQLPLVRALHLLSASRWSLFGEVGYEVHPLVRASVFAIASPADGSSVVVPTATWSAAENVDISLIGLFFTGDPATEYGSFGTSLFLRGKYSF